MSIEKSTTEISPILSNLIAEANFTIEQSQTTIKEKLLAVYEQARKEGYTPQESRKLMKEKIVNVSDRYIREVLPEEAKQTKYANKELNSNAEQFRIPEEEQISELEKFRQEKGTSNGNVNDIVNEWAERNQQDIENQKSVIYQDGENSVTSNVYTTATATVANKETYVKELEQKIETLELQLNRIFSGTADLVVRDTTLPLKWQFVIVPKPQIVIGIDEERARRMKI